MNLNVESINGNRLWFKCGVIDTLSVCKLNGKNVGETPKPKICTVNTEQTIDYKCNYVIINSVSNGITIMTLSAPSCKVAFKLKNITVIPITINANFTSGASIVVGVNESVELVYDKKNKYWIKF